MPKAAKEEKKEKIGAKKLSAYNVFMKTELPKVRAAHSALNHKEAFKLAASNWKKSAQNPKNKK